MLPKYFLFCLLYFDSFLPLLNLSIISIKLFKNEKKASKRAEDLLDVYYNTLSTADMEFPYWYNREYRKSDGDI
ncbi:hypothetical protein ACTPD5_22875, partial [Clostridioides difficile]|uniref:hypothetical protein n=1 Tax=Clostridioides difficile TaxID=1496 RepID=UPI003F8D1E71